MKRITAKEAFDIALENFESDAGSRISDAEISRTTLGQVECWKVALSWFNRNGEIDIDQGEIGEGPSLVYVYDDKRADVIPQF